MNYVPTMDDKNENPSVAALGFSIPILGMEGLNP